jgi:hypothetical protein
MSELEYLIVACNIITSVIVIVATSLLYAWICEITTMVGEISEIVDKTDGKLDRMVIGVKMQEVKAKQQACVDAIDDKIKKLETRVKNAELEIDYERSN